MSRLFLSLVRVVGAAFRFLGTGTRAAALFEFRAMFLINSFIE